MKNEISNHYSDRDEEDSNLRKEVLLKYLPYWPWFLGAVITSLFVGYLYTRYTSEIYESSAKIKIIDDTKEMDIISDPLAALSGSSKINLDNEIEVLKSHLLINQVVKELGLAVQYRIIGNVKTTEIWEPPFKVQKIIPEDSITNSISYEVKLGQSEFNILDENGKIYTSSYFDSRESTTPPILPFRIELQQNLDVEKFEEITYRVDITRDKHAVQQLIKDMQVKPTDRKSEVLVLTLKGESSKRSEAILNATIARFNQDGILDRQLVSKRTMDFIDERFIYLSEELDSIESGKQDFKQDNNLSYIQEDATITLQKKSENEQEVFNLQTQISISDLLKETIENEKAYSLLPSNIGLEDNSINLLVAEYNELVLERERLMTTVGESHPTLQVLNSQLERGKQNILNTVDIYLKQQRMALRQGNAEKELAGSMFSRLPEKEKMLRAIERQQNIKENLFLLLLQKREEAAINFAVTAPSVKVVDFGLSGNRPVSPKKLKVFPIAFFMGLFVPFSVLFVKFYLDTKLHDRSDLEKINPEIPVLVEIPILEEGKMMQGQDRSILAESFRILGTNINYLLPQRNNEDKGQVIFITSTIKGEGKTLIAVNTSLAYASLNKKVLLLGADLRNPQLHSYVDYDKNSKGLSDYLSDAMGMDWRDCLRPFGKNPTHQVLLSGPIPPNPPQLLSNTLFSKFLEEAQTEFDYIVIDTAPTLLVTDTLIISQNADITLFVTRADFTEKRLLEFSKDLNKTKKLKNMAYVVNGVDRNKFKGYNYGYGYGYNADVKKAPWYSGAFNFRKGGFKKINELFNNRKGSN